MSHLTFFGLPMETWQFINTFAPWLSAVGTLSAVTVSLWLALSRNRPKVKLSAGHRLIIGPDIKRPYPEMLALRVVNVGEKTVRVTGIGWQVGFWRWKELGVQMVGPPVAGSSRMPIEIEHAQEATWYVPFDQQPDSWPISFSQKFLLPRWQWNLFTMRVWVSTSVGMTFRAKIDGSLRKKLVEQCKSLRSTDGAASSGRSGG